MNHTVTATAEETFQLGVQFGQALEAPCIIALYGDLGAGKTTFIRGIAASIGADPQEVCSPTFAYLNIYQGRTAIYHFDLYRIPTQQEFIAAGFDEYLNADGICCIEWSEKISSLLQELYRNNLKNRALTASAFSQNSHLHSRLVHAQWSLAPDENFEKPSCQIPDSSGCFGIVPTMYRVNIAHVGEGLREIQIL